jgi:hypothetical protein
MTGDDSSVNHNYAGLYGGGVWSIGGGGTIAQIIMVGERAEISFNAMGGGSEGGGGILADGSSTDATQATHFVMSGNHAKIHGNQGRAGGGIQLYDVGTRGVMSGEYAEISGNVSGGTSGGLAVITGATFIMEAGELSNNAASAFYVATSQFGSNGGNPVWPAGTRGMVWLDGLSDAPDYVAYNAYDSCAIPDSNIGGPGIEQTPATVYRAVKVSQ